MMQVSTQQQRQPPSFIIAGWKDKFKAAEGLRIKEKLPMPETMEAAEELAGKLIDQHTRTFEIPAPPPRVEEIDDDDDEAERRTKTVPVTFVPSCFVRVRHFPIYPAYHIATAESFDKIQSVVVLSEPTPEIRRKEMVQQTTNMTAAAMFKVESVSAQDDHRNLMSRIRGDQPPRDPGFLSHLAQELEDLRTQLGQQQQHQQQLEMNDNELLAPPPPVSDQEQRLLQEQCKMQ